MLFSKIVRLILGFTLVADLRLQGVAFLLGIFVVVVVVRLVTVDVHLRVNE
jgi:hypothetical protein